MKLARYMGGGEIAIVSEPEPVCPPGGLLVRTEASGLCSGELMDWYMDSKIPHVLGHEVCGVVVESQDGRFPVGSRVAPHHHAPCFNCDLCARRAYVHCEQWKRTKLVPGGMAEYFAVAAENLSDTIAIGAPQEVGPKPANVPFWVWPTDASHVRAMDAALIEPLGCVVKSFSRGLSSAPPARDVAVIGLGFMGIMHMLVLQGTALEGQPLNLVGYETNPRRLEWARDLGLDARLPDEAVPATTVYVCPGSEEALRFASEIVHPGGEIRLFSPLPPPGEVALPLNDFYFRDVALIPSYSCGPDHTMAAYRLLCHSIVKAEQVVSDFISIDELPRAYKAMKAGEILKPMVLF